MKIDEFREKYPQYGNLSDVELADKLHKKFYSDMERGKFFTKFGLIGNDPEYDPTEDMSWLDKALAGAGKFFVDTARGVEQAARDVIPGESEREKELDHTIAQERKLSQPLMETGAGMAGNIGAGVISAAPAMFIPGANTVVGSGLLGAGLAGSQPVVGDESRVGNMALGAAFGVAGQYAGQKLGQAAGRAIQNRSASRTANQARDRIVSQAKGRGYSIPPSQTRPTGVKGFVNNRLTGVAGKASTQQATSIRNQPITNRLVKQSLDLPEDQPITAEVLDEIRSNAGKLYDEMKKLGSIEVDDQFKEALEGVSGSYRKLASQYATQGSKKVDDLLEDMGRESFDADSAVELVKNLRFQAGKNLRSMDDPEKALIGKIQKGIANEIENLMERKAVSQGADDLVEQFRKGRQMYAKTFSVEDALTPSGDVNAARLAKQLDKGKPLSGELEEVARFAQQFPKANQLVNDISTGTSPLDIGLGVGGAITTGNPAWLGLMLARPTARKMVSSPLYQKAMGSPAYGTSGAQAVRGLLANPAALHALRTVGPASVGLLQE